MQRVGMTANIGQKQHTKRIWVGLALNQCMEAGSTMGGELMRAPPKYGPQKLPRGGWICPITRIRKELGMDFFWTARGPVIDGGKLNKPIVGIEINGLPYCTWDQFQSIRWALQQSHQMGRKAAVTHCGIHGGEVAAQYKERAEAANSNTHQVRSNSRWNKNASTDRRGNTKWNRL